MPVSNMECVVLSETNACVTSEDIIRHLTQNKEVYFKSQQIGEEDLTLLEKEAIAKNILHRDKCNFLSRFGKHLKLEHLEYFKPFLDEDLVTFHYNNLVRYHTKSAHAIDIRNRRFEALKKLIENDSYFSEQEMMKRNPLLYDQLIGKYLTEEERKMRDSVKNGKDVTFVNILMEGIERDIAEDKRKAQKAAEATSGTDEDSNSGQVFIQKNGPFAKIQWNKLSQKRNDDEEEEEEDSDEDTADISKTRLGIESGHPELDTVQVDLKLSENNINALEKNTRISETDSIQSKSVSNLPEIDAIPMETDSNPTETDPEASSTSTSSKRFVAFRISPKKLDKPKKPLPGHVSHREDIRSKAKRNHKLTERCKKWGEYEAIEEIRPWKRKDIRNEPEPVAISVQERNILRDEFLSLMYQSFLDGKDDFDYSTVDFNEEYDNVEIIEQDAEEKYFESESPNEENDSNSCGNPPNGNMDTNSSEDELDVFMERLNKHPTVCQLSQDMKNL